MGLFFHPEEGRKQVWSCGGGTQSNAIAALIIQGKLPKPDIAFIVDTEREKEDTFPYLEQYTRPGLASVDVELHVVKKSRYSPVDLTARNGKDILLPAFTTETGNVGKMPAFCSGEWKRDAGNRWLREQGVEDCDVWIGFSLDEIRRIGADHLKWRRNVFPLIELRLNRRGCERIVTEFGWPPSPRSACWMCSNQSDDEWRRMKANNPDDWAKAVQLDRKLREDDPDLWLHRTCQPLDQIDFDALADDQPLFGACASGMCFT